ncbi:MAG: hypothetical protein ACKOW2_09160 [Sphingobacteriaceae bacterium]
MERLYRTAVFKRKAGLEEVELVVHSVFDKFLLIELLRPISSFLLDQKGSKKSRQNDASTHWHLRMACRSVGPTLFIDFRFFIQLSGSEKQKAKY